MSMTVGVRAIRTMRAGIAVLGTMRAGIAQADVPVAPPPPITGGHWDFSEARQGAHILTAGW